MKDKGGITVANGSRRGQEVDEGHEDQSRAFDKATHCFNFNVFSAVKDRSKSRERKVKTWRDLSQTHGTSICVVITTSKCS